VQITVCVRRAIVVDNDVHTLNVNTATKNVSGNQYTLLKSLECSVALDSETMFSYYYTWDETYVPLLLL
jgi:hypothetical protein